jgi:tRNA (uracil-5-)-methyltransferase
LHRATLASPLQTLRKAPRARVRTTPLPADLAKQLPYWVLTNPRQLHGQACRLLPIQPSPIQHGYRNKCAFTLGVDAAGLPTAGFRMSSFADSTAVAPPDGCPHVPLDVVAVAAAVTCVLRRGDLPVYSAIDYSGCWRTLTVRWAGSTRQVMVDVTIAPPPGVGPVTWNDELRAALAAPELPAVPAAISAGGPVTVTYFKGLRALVQALLALKTPQAAVGDSEGAAASSSAAGAASSSAAARAPIDVVSIVAQEFSGRGQMPEPNHPHVLLHGRDAVEEAMCGMRFRISPGAFFQVNTPAAERLYHIVRALALEGEAGAVALGAPIQARGSGSREAGGAGAAGAAGEGGDAAAEDAAAEDAADASDAAEAAEAAAAADAAVAPEAAATSLVADTESSAAPVAAAAASSGTASFAGELTPLPAPTPRPDHAVLDVCCCTGTIGLVCAPHVGRVVGVELSAAAVEDAKRNAVANGVANAVFLCERAEAVMKDVIQRASDAPAPTAAAAADGATASSSSAGAAAVPITNVVAIVDPPRGGLHPSVIRALRTCKPLKRIVYVSCNPTGSLIEDAVKLCAPQEENSAYARGPPLRPVLAVPVDLFPDTPHCEMVVLFERN